MDTKERAYPIRVGLLYGHKPSGHYSAARALADFFPAHVMEPVFVDLSEVYPKLGSFVAKTYLGILNKTPALWDYVYDNELVALAANGIKTAVFPYYSGQLREALREKNLQAVVSTHALAAMLLAGRDTASKAAPLFAVLTDYYAHSYWPPNGVERYFIPDKSVEAGLKANGTQPNKMITTGIPVRKEFLTQADARQKRKELGLAPDLFTVLLTGGSKGLGEIRLAAETLKKFAGRLQIVAMCGENKKLGRALTDLFGGNRQLKIAGGFAQHPASLYQAADLVVGKAGGITIAETMALNKPMLLFSPLPGQEERNAGFLLKNGLADFAEDPRRLETLIKKYLRHPGALAALKEAIAKTARPYAAREIAAGIMERLF
ncbi:MAG: glycosyltransferase [Elusimicrobiales bacterium]|jgi:processive 1,2-diacylglycerol beta-glucosyltransferase